MNRLDEIKVWPPGLTLGTEGDPTIRLVHIDDVDRYHPQLIATLLELEQQEHRRRSFFRGAGGTKIYDVEQWGSPEADLVAARARRLCQEVLHCDTVVTESSWANIYRAGDYCMPHSHVRCTASVVYFLALGESDPEDPLSGRFFFADDRLAGCCRDQEGCVTNPILPELRAGSMIIFPAQVIHCVNPYTGGGARITLAWNLNPTGQPDATGTAAAGGSD